MTRAAIALAAIMFSLSAQAGETMSGWLNGEKKSFICDIADEKQNEIIYVFDNPINRVLTEDKIIRNGKQIVHDPKAPPIWTTRQAKDEQGIPVLVLSNIDDADYRLVMQDRPIRNNDRYEEFPTSFAQLWKRDKGIIARGECHVIVN